MRRLIESLEKVYLVEGSEWHKSETVFDTKGMRVERRGINVAYISITDLKNALKPKKTCEKIWAQRNMDEQEDEDAVYGVVLKLERARNFEEAKNLIESAVANKVFEKGGSKMLPSMDVRPEHWNDYNFSNGKISIYAGLKSFRVCDTSSMGNGTCLHSVEKSFPESSAIFANMIAQNREKIEAMGYLEIRKAMEKAGIKTTER
jgi:uncharacterized protein YbaA (DUF1428 family)